MGHLFVTDDPTPKPIVVTLVRNKQGRWIGENVLDFTKDLVKTMTEELSPMILGQIYKWRELEAAREEKEKEKFEMDKWHAELEKREEELHEKEMRLRAGLEG
jgi:rubrerythrin